MGRKKLREVLIAVLVFLVGGLLMVKGIQAMTRVVWLYQGPIGAVWQDPLLGWKLIYPGRVLLGLEILCLSYILAGALICFSAIHYAKKHNISLCQG